MQPANRHSRRGITVIHCLFAMTLLHVPATVADEQSHEEQPVAIPKGMRVVSIRVSGVEPSLSSLKPGEEVDIFHRSEVDDAEGNQQRGPGKLVADNVNVFAINELTLPHKEGSQLETVSILATVEQTRVIAAAQEEGVLELRRRDKKNALVTSATALDDPTEPPFDGEWRTHSIDVSNYSDEDYSADDLAAFLKYMRSSVFIRDGVLHEGSETTKLEVRAVDSFTWRVTGPDSSTIEGGVCRKLGTVLRIEVVDSGVVLIQEFRSTGNRCANNTR